MKQMLSSTATQHLRSVLRSADSGPCLVGDRLWNRVFSSAASEAEKRGSINNYMSQASPVSQYFGMLLGAATTFGGAYWLYQSVTQYQSHAGQSQPWWSSSTVQQGLTAFGGFSGAAAVGLGAFGFHGLGRFLAGKVKDVSTMKHWWEIATSYQLWHSAALLAAQQLPPACSVPASMGFGAGILLFSGSLYGYILTGNKFFQYMTPFGGLAYIGGWATIGLYAAFQATMRNTSAPSGQDQESS